MVSGWGERSALLGRREVVVRLLDPRRTFPEVLIEEIRLHGTDRVIEAICGTVDVTRANASEVLLWAMERAGAADVGAALRHVMQEARG